MVKKRREAPSRRKYEEAHPVLSFRVPRKIYDELRAVRESTGESATKVLMVGLGLYKVRVETEKEIWQKGYDKGYDNGVDAACRCYMVTYPCSTCGEEIVVDTEEQKKAIRQYMVDHGWGHADCVNR